FSWIWNAIEWVLHFSAATGFG
ncbi:hypothetical protein Tco_1350190, partial [Tanacetum coccineum]